MVNLAYFCRFELKFIVFALTYDDALFVLLQFLVLVVEKLFFERLVLFVDYFILVVNLVVLLQMFTCFLVFRNDEMFKIIILHLTFEVPLIFLFVLSFGDLVIQLGRILVD